MEETNTQDFAERYLALEERVRRLSIQAPDDWEWYSLRHHLCAGWIDPYCDSPYRYDLEDDPTQTLGYFDTGHSIVFTGVAYWDPEGWWATPPVTLTGTGNPDLALDVRRFIYGGYNAFAAFVGHGHADAGLALPYRTVSDNLTFFDFPINHRGGGANQLRGSGTQVIWGSLQMETFSGPHGGFPGTNIYCAGGGVTDPDMSPPPVDVNGFTHYSLPAETMIILQGQSFMYDTAIGRVA
jgi:hypothetical protein